MKRYGRNRYESLEIGLGVVVLRDATSTLTCQMPSEFAGVVMVWQSSIENIESNLNRQSCFCLDM